MLSTQNSFGGNFPDEVARSDGFVIPKLRTIYRTRSQGPTVSSSRSFEQYTGRDCKVRLFRHPEASNNIRTRVVRTTCLLPSKVHCSDYRSLYRRPSNDTTKVSQPRLLCPFRREEAEPCDKGLVLSVGARLRLASYTLRMSFSFAATFSSITFANLSVNFWMAS